MQANLAQKAVQYWEPYLEDDLGAIEGEEICTQGVQSSLHQRLFVSCLDPNDCFHCRMNLFQNLDQALTSLCHRCLKPGRLLGRPSRQKSSWLAWGGFLGHKICQVGADRPWGCSTQTLPQEHIPWTLQGFRGNHTCTMFFCCTPWMAHRL